MKKEAIVNSQLFLKHELFIYLFYCIYLFIIWRWFGGSLVVCNWSE